MHIKIQPTAHPDSLKHRYELVGDPSGDAYKRVLQFAARHGATFSVVIQDERPSLSMLRALAALKPFELDVSPTHEWPGTIASRDSRPALLYRYAIDDRAIEALAQLARGLYSWQNRELPDDLSFYRSDGSVLIASTAHEDFAALELTDDEAGGFGDMVGLGLKPIARN